MTPQESSEVIKWACESFDTVGFVTYEQILPNDPFGQVMLQNLQVLHYAVGGDDRVDGCWWWCWCGVDVI